MSESVLDRLEAVLDELADSELGSSDEVLRLVRAGARFDAVTSRTVARWDANREWAVEGAKSPASWLAIRCRVDKRKASRLLRLGRACRDMPKVEAAWLAGEVHAEQVQVLAAVRHLDASPGTSGSWSITPRRCGIRIS